MADSNELDTKLRPYQLAVMKKIREMGETITVGYPYQGDRSARERAMIFEGELAHMQFQKFSQALNTQIINDPALRKGASRIVVNSYAALDWETNPFMSSGRYDGIVTSGTPRTGKTIVAHQTMLDLKLFPTRRLTQNQVSRRNLFHSQLNDQLPPVSRMRRAVQSAIKNWSSK